MQESQSRDEARDSARSTLLPQPPPPGEEKDERREAGDLQDPAARDEEEKSVNKCSTGWQPVS